MAEEEVLAEVEAAQAVYGDDCLVLDKYPPHIHVHIRPRTADVSSQQFVEAVIGILAVPQYPIEPPQISVIDCKGLDDQRQKHLINSIRDKARELSSYLMLIALCEEAVERLTSMNHPDGDCPLCLHPLVEEEADNNSLPFMKLMSCFHCFHCACIIRWWNWLQMEKEKDSDLASGVTARLSGDAENQQGLQGKVERNRGKCPVCRKVFHAKDIEHVLDLVGSQSQLHSGDQSEANDDEDLLQSDSENIRRKKFEAILKLQQENKGLFEPKKNEVLLPGMFLPRSTPSPSTTSDKETTDQHKRDPAVTSNTNSSDSSNRSSASERKKSHTRKHSGQNSRRQARQWIRKDSGTPN